MKEQENVENDGKENNDKGELRYTEKLGLPS